MTVETGKVPHTHKELANYKKIAFEHEKLLLLKSPQNKAASTFAITEKTNKSNISLYTSDILR